MARAPAGPVPVVVMGLGFIGQEIARAAQASPEVELIGAVDTSPQLVGATLCRRARAVPGRKLEGRPARWRRRVGRRKGVVLLHATGSRLPQVMDQLLEALEARACPWSPPARSWPSRTSSTRSWRRSWTARRRRPGVAVLGTGVNPGFVMDRLVATPGQVCGPVRHVTATRVVDARTRREALQRKVGAGLTEDEFFALVDKDQLGHVGLVESAALCALGLGMDCDDFEEEIVPVFAEEDITGGAFPVKKGRVAGIFQTAVGLEEGQERVRLELTIAVGADDPGTASMIDADPQLVLEITGAWPGTGPPPTRVVNAAPRVTAAEAGLLTVLELPAGR